MRDLTLALAPSWRGDPALREIQRVNGLALDRLDEDVRVWLDQFRIETATAGLAMWERAVGIETDLTLSLDWRRAKVKAKLQGLGVTTDKVICAIVERFTGGVATLQEGVDKHTFRVTVDGVINQPENMEVMRHSVTEVKPAHLAHEYALRYQSGRLAVGCGMAVQEVKQYHYSLEGKT